MDVKILQHLSTLLASTDSDIIVASLQTLAAFVKKSVAKCSIRDSALNTKLFALSQGWGGKEGGLGLVACSTEHGCDSVAYQVGCTLHFEFYAEQSILKEDTGNDDSRASGLHIIHLPDLISHPESDLQLLKHLVDRYMVPLGIRFSLFTRLRFARAFPHLATRRQYVCIRLYAFMVLVQASSDADDLAAFFVNEPEFVNELVMLLCYEDVVPEEIRILAILALSALYLDRSRQASVLNVITSGGHRDILPSLMQKAIDSITSGSIHCSISYVQALLSLVTVLVSSSSGCSALREAGFIPTLLPLLKDLNPQHVQLVSTAVHVLEAFMDYSNPAATLFRDLGGLDDTISRLKMEVCCIEKGPRKHGEESQLSCKGKSSASSAAESEVIQVCHSETLVAYHRRLLMKALLRAISLGTYAPGSTARLYGSEECMLPFCLSTIFKRAKDFGGGVFSLAATVMSDLIHKDPTCFSVLDSAGLPTAFLDSIMDAVLASAEAVACIPQCLDALCLNNLGLQAVKDRNALRCFVTIFTSRTYLRALTGDAPGTLSTGLDELMRHAASLRGPGVDMLIEILNTIAKIGCGAEASSSFQESAISVAPVPMETDLEGGTPVSVGGGKLSRTETSEQPVEVSLENSYINVETFLPECISNAARLLENVLQNADTCRVFMEKKGVEAVLQLFNLPLLPLSFPSGQNISVAFKNFSPQHSSALTRTVCSFLKEQLKHTIEDLDSLAGINLGDVEGPNQMKILKCMSGLEGILSFSTFLLKNTTTMMTELGSSEAEVLNDVGKTYKEILWQFSLLSNAKIDAKREVEQGAGTAANSISNTGSRESDDDTSMASVRYVNPVSVRSGPASQWGVEPEYLSIIDPGEGLPHHSQSDHGAEEITSMHTGHLDGHAEALQVDVEGSINAAEASQMQESKQKSLDVFGYEIVNKLAFALRSFIATLVKGLVVPNRRRADTGLLSGAAKNLAAALAKVYHDNLSFNGHCNLSGLESSVSVKCRYLGKVVDDMAGVIFDSRRRVCNTALINYFYSYGTIKELLTTFEATSQLLWTLPKVSPSVIETGHGKRDENGKLEHSSWLLETLHNYCRLLEYLVSSSFLLSPTSASQLLVQPVAGGSLSVPRDPEVFVRTLQAQVLDAVLPIWNHSMFSQCSPSLITSIVSIITHIYSGIGDWKRSRNGMPGSAGQRLMGPPPDESAISMIVEMGFSRARAEEALRRVETNSVEMAMEWLFSHPEEPVQEDDELARALALSLGNSAEAARDDASDKVKDAPTEVKGPEAPPIENILATSMKLLQSTDSIAFPLTDLIVTLCNQNSGQDRHRVVSYLIQQLKLCKVDGSESDTSLLCTISHILALVLVEDSSGREIAAENGIVSVALDILTSFKLTNTAGEKALIPKWVIALFLILDHMLHYKPRISSDTQSTAGTGSNSLVNASEDATLTGSVSVNDGKIADLDNSKEGNNPFVGILEKSMGYMTADEHRRALNIACDFIYHHVPATTMQAVLQLCARLTKSHPIAMQFLERGGLTALFSLPRGCFFPGFDNVAAAIIRHLLEDPQTLQTAMELEIRQTLMSSLNHHGGRVTPRTFLTSMAPVISRDPSIFMRAATAVCQLENVGGRPNIILSKEKEKDKDKEKEKEKEKDREKTKAAGQAEIGVPSGDYTRVHEGLGRLQDGSGKCTKGHKKVPHSFTQVIDQLLEVILHYPPLSKQEECTGSTVPMEVDEPASKEKGKLKVEEIKKSGSDSISESSAELAKVTFVLKLMSDVLLMYIHAVGVVLRRDSESSQGRGPCQLGVDLTGHGGLLYHVLHRLLPCIGDRMTEGMSEEWREKLSEKASWFLVVVCGRSGEGRRREIGEIVRALLLAASSDKKNIKHVEPPNRKVLAFVDLVNSILSKNSSSGNVVALGCFPDIAKTMIDAGMIQALTSTLQMIDLDHPEAPKLVNLILKALEALTRAANTVEEVYRTEGSNKQKPLATDERAQDQSNLASSGEEAQAERDQNRERQVAGLEQNEGRIAEAISESTRDQEGNPNVSMEHDMGTETDDTVEAHPAVEQDVEFIREEVEEATDLRNSTTVEMTFHVEHRADDDMGDEDEDMNDDGDDDGEEDDEDEDEEDEEDEIGEEGATHMSLADTDAEDHEDNGLIDEYGDEMLEEDDEDFHENRVIEVRWREGLDGLDRLQVLGRPGGVGSLVDNAGEPFQELSGDDMYRILLGVGVDRRRQTSHRPFIDRSGLDRGGAFQHPLLTRPSQSSDPSGSLWASSGSMSRDAEAVPVGSFDVAHFYMFDAPIRPPEHAGATVFGERGVGGPPPLLEFSVDPLYLLGRRGPGDGRWTDDGQPQAGAQAAAIAQAVEEQFISQLRTLSPIDDQLRPGLTENIDQGEGRQQTTSPLMDTETQTILPVDDVNGEENREHRMSEVEPAHSQENATIEGNEAGFTELTVQSRADVGATITEEGSDRAMRDLESGIQDSVGSVATMGESLYVLGVESGTADGHLETEQHLVTQTLEVPSVTRDFESGYHDSVGSGATMGEGFHNLGVETGSADGCVETESFPVPQRVEVPTVVVSDTEFGRTNAAGAGNVDEIMEATGPVNQTEETSAGPNRTSNETPAPQQVQGFVPAGNQGEQVDRSNGDSGANTIDPTFLEALPEDLRAEVLASQHAQSVPSSNYAPPPAEEIDPEFLAALPPDIQAEVLAQQHAQRAVQAQQAEGHPVDMDNASIIATFPADLREEVLLTSSEAVLAALPSPLLAEAQMLRDRSMSHYQAHSLFGGGHRLGGRRNSMAGGGQSVIDRGVGLTLGRRQGSSFANGIKGEEVEGKPLVDTAALKSMLQLLRLAQV
eukprot:Gb_26784 [translate_table: standard]